MSKSKIKFGIPQKNAKRITVEDREYMIPTLTVYHRKYLGNARSKEVTMYDFILPLVKKVSGMDESENIRTDIFEYLAINILQHNRMLLTTCVIDNEKFSLDDLEICSKTEFQHDGLLYKFKSPLYENGYDSFLVGMNDLQIDSKHNFREMDAIFFKYAHDLFSTVKVVGEFGNELRGLNLILDNFANMDRIKELGGKYGRL